MGDITHSDPVVTESTLKNFYDDIKPFLGCPAYLTSEGISDYYSTDEKVIGRWIDGKPIYQCVYNLGSLIRISNSTWTSVGMALNDKQTILRALGTNSYNGASIQTISGELLTCVKNNEIVFLASRDGEVLECTYIVLQFTKSTDSAVTTTQEDPNEYSTDEKIIGKWIDGKPIYQRTWQTTTPSNASAGVVISSASLGVQLSQVIKLDGYIDNGGHIDINWYYSSNRNVNSFYDRTQNSVFMVCSAAAEQNKTVYITLQYTKNSD